MNIRTVPLAVVLLIAGCASGSGSSPTSSAAPSTTTPTATPTVTAAPTPAATVQRQLIGTVVIRLDGCDLEASAEPIHAGPVTLLVVNESGFPAAADLFGILADAGGTFEDLAQDTEVKHQAALRGETTGSHPGYLRGIATNKLVAPGEQARTYGNAAAGTAAIVCLRKYEETGTINPLDTAGPIEILGSP